MNNKQETMMRIVDIVVGCTSSNIDGIASISREDILGASKKANHSMARGILAIQLVNEGYTVTTISMLLKRNEQSIRQIIRKGYNCIATSRAARRAAAQVVLECDKLFSEDTVEN